MGVPDPALAKPDLALWMLDLASRVQSTPSNGRHESGEVRPGRHRILPGGRRIWVSTSPNRQSAVSYSLPLTFQVLA